MTQKQCPACGKLVAVSKGSAAEYLRFDCLTHGPFEIHERMANHLTQPQYQPQMVDLDKWIAEHRVENPSGVLIRTFNPRVSEVQK